MAKIVLTLLDGKVLTRDTKVIGSESGCCCCFCSDTCERCVLVDVEFGTTSTVGPPIYQMLDNTAYAPAPPFCAEIRIVISRTTAQWAEYTSTTSPPYITTYNNDYLLDTVGDYAEEILEDGTKKYKTKQVHPMTSTGRSKSKWKNNTYVNLPDNNLYVAYIPPSGECGCDPTRQQLYLFCLKGDGKDGPFAKIPTSPGWTVKPKKIFNIDIDLHECGWVLVVQKSTCGQTVDADSSCSMNFARIPSDDTGCPELGNYRTVSTFLSPTEIAAKDPPIECPDDHEDKLEDENENKVQDEDEEVAVVCENDTKKDPDVYEIADCDSRQDSLLKKGVYYNKDKKFWPRTEGEGTDKGKWGATVYSVKVRKTLRKTENKSGTVGTTLCCVPDAPESYYYFIETGSWSTLANWRVSFTSGDEGFPQGGFDPDIPTYTRSFWRAGGQIPPSLPTKLDRVIIQKTVTTIPANTEVLSMDVIDTNPDPVNKPKVSINGIITTTEFCLFNDNTELLAGQLLGTGQIIFRNNSEVSTNGVIGHATKTNDFTLIKFKNSSINRGKIYYRFCTITGQTNVAESIKRFVNFYDTSINEDGAFVYYTPAMFFDTSTNKGIICKDFGKGASTNMNTLVENEGYPRSFFYDQSTNIAGATVVGAASFYNLAQNLGTINNAIDPYADKSINSAKFYGLVIMDNFGGNRSENGPTGEILGYADFYDNASNYGDVIKDLTLHDYSSCGYKPGNDEDSINVGGDLIMKHKSSLGGAKIKIVGSLTTGTLGSLTESPDIINSNIEVANNTNLYSHTQVQDSQILCTTDNKTMTINDTSIIHPPYLLITEKTTIKYAIVIFNDNADNSGKIIPYSSPNTTTFNDSSINRSEDIVGVLIFNDTSINNVTKTTANTFISITFNGGSANLGYITTTDTNKDGITFNNSSYNDANALIRGNVIFNGTSENKGVGVVDITISIDPSSATLYDTNPAGETHPTVGEVTLFCQNLGVTSPTINGLQISYNACQSYFITNGSDFYVCDLVATLETTPAGAYTYSIVYDGMDIYYEILGNDLYRYDYWYGNGAVAIQSPDIPPSVVITTTDNNSGTSFTTTLTITYAAYDPAYPPDYENQELIDFLNNCSESGYPAL